MTEANCSIIRDLLPLYVDGVVSDETKEFVEKHLERCEACRKDAGLMKQEVTIPVVKDDKLIKDIKKKWRNKKWMISGLSVLITGIVLFGAYYFIFHHDTVIPYSEALVHIETEGDGTLISRYHGTDYYSVHAAGPLSVNINGEEKKVIFIYYTETIAESHSKTLFQREKNSSENTFLFPLADQDEVDVIYYTHFDVRKVVDEGNYWENVLEHAELLWEK